LAGFLLVVWKKIAIIKLYHRKMIYFEEYQWAVDHPSNKDSIEFLNLDWGGNLDRIRANELATKIRKRWINKMPDDVNLVQLLNHCRTKTECVSWTNSWRGAWEASNATTVGFYIDYNGRS
jgi:hypothetical protein